VVPKQETGRAGRDGKVATCILYYGYGDAVRMRHMLRQSAEEQNTAPAQLECNMDSLNHMVRALFLIAPTQSVALRSLSVPLLPSMH
jgi:superfamily II DNA helicase RecQ